MSSNASDIYEPLVQYKKNFKASFESEAKLAFEELVKKSGVDIEANRALIAELKITEKNLKSQTRKRRWWSIVIFLSIVAALAPLGYGIYAVVKSLSVGMIVLSALAFIFFLSVYIFAVRPVTKRLNTTIKMLQNKADEIKAHAYEILEPLNKLYDWDMANRLVTKVVPKLQFDAYFNEGRLTELCDDFGLGDVIGKDGSVCAAQSGTINGNPFVIANAIQTEMGEETYTGTRTVSWKERQRVGNKYQTVTQYQTLVATITRPKPIYHRCSFLIYGNDAAPILTFSREPSELSGSDGFFSRQALKSEISKLEKLSRNLDDDSDYTIMGNKEFEALFKTTDRNDEKEYRLLFTPLAQKQILQLLKDKKIGYGDDFYFTKARKINLIQAEHMNEVPIDGDPNRFVHYDLEEARKIFNTYCNDYFKSVYFSFAPLLSIPLYQQIKSQKTLYGEFARNSSSWEHEALANYFGDKYFADSRSQTQNIYKTSVEKRDENVAKIEVTGYGYATKKRTFTVSVMARNMRYYDVDVDWIEYIPVAKKSSMTIAELENYTTQKYRSLAESGSSEYNALSKKLGKRSSAAKYRRSIVAAP